MMMTMIIIILLPQYFLQVKEKSILFCVQFGVEGPLYIEMAIKKYIFTCPANTNIIKSQMQRCHFTDFSF